jgi:hypothetical protein
VLGKSPPSPPIGAPMEEKYLGENGAKMVNYVIFTIIPYQLSFLFRIFAAETKTKRKK